MAAREVAQAAAQERRLWEALLAHEANDLACTDPDAEMEATVVVDLVKAFERVSLQAVWAWAN